MSAPYPSPAEQAVIDRFGIFDAEERVETVARALMEPMPEWRGGSDADYWRMRAAAAIAALPPSPAEEAVKRRLELARIEGRAESLNAEVHEMEDDDDAQLLAIRAIQWEQEAAVLRATLASPAPAPQGGEQR